MPSIPYHLLRVPSIPYHLLREMDAHQFICGSDEVGLGSWAGPLVVCAVVVPRTWSCSGLTDSKKLSITKREKLYPILSKTVPHFIVRIDPEEIDQNGISVAWEKAHIAAIQGAIEAHRAQGHTELPFVIVDGSRGFFGATPLPKADTLIPAVSAASILAKVYRDHIMYEMDTVYPGYGLKSHVGYGTEKHRIALEKLGVTPIHRKSYAPIAKMVEPKMPDVMDLLETIDQGDESAGNT